MGEALRGSPETILALSYAFLEAGRTPFWAATHSGRVSVGVYADEAVRFCAVGALLRAVYEETGFQVPNTTFLLGSVEQVASSLPPVVRSLVTWMDAWVEAYKHMDLIEFHDTPGRRLSALAALWSDAFHALEEEQLL